MPPGAQPLPHVELLVIAGCIALGFGAPMLLWALAADWWRVGRHRLAIRCPRCWYDMRGSPTLQCSECGYTARSQRQQRKSRRCWWRVAFGLTLCILGLGGVLSPRVLNTEWTSRLPNWVLILALDDPTIPPPPWGGNSTPTLSVEQMLVREVWSRYARGSVSARQRAAVARRQFADDRAPVYLETREVWPIGVPVYARLQSQFTGVLERTMTAMPVRLAAETMSSTTEARWSSGGNYLAWPTRQPHIENRLLCLGTPPAGMDGLTLKVSIDEAGTTLWQGDVTQPFRVAGTVDDVIKPLADDQLDALVRAELSRMRVLQPDWVGFTSAGNKRLAGVTCGLQIDLLEDRDVIASAQMVFTFTGETAASAAISTMGQMPRFVRNAEADAADIWRPLTGNIERIARAAAPDSRWFLRIRGTGELALQDFKAERYWKGEITVPVKFAQILR